MITNSDIEKLKKVFVTKSEFNKLKSEVKNGFGEMKAGFKDMTKGFQTITEMFGKVFDKQDNHETRINKLEKEVFPQTAN